MFVCPTCEQEISVTSLREVRGHLSFHQKFISLVYPINCKQQSCNSSVASIDAFVQHFQRYHIADIEAVYAQHPPAQPSLEIEPHSPNFDHLSSSNSPMETVEPFSLIEEMSSVAKSLKTNAFEFSIDCRKKSTLTHSATSEFFLFLISTVDLLVDLL